MGTVELDCITEVCESDRRLATGAVGHQQILRLEEREDQVSRSKHYYFYRSAGTILLTLKLHKLKLQTENEKHQFNFRPFEKGIFHKTAMERLANGTALIRHLQSLQSAIMTASAVGALKINQPKFRASTVTLFGMTSGEKTWPFIMRFSGQNALIFAIAPY